MKLKLWILRKEAGLTQKQLAEKMGVKRITVYQWEKQKRNLNAPNIVKLLQIFNCKFEDLVEYEAVTAENK